MEANQLEHRGLGWSLRRKDIELRFAGYVEACERGRARGPSGSIADYCTGLVIAL